MSSGRHRAGSACSSPERCARRHCASDGLTVRMTDGPMLTDVDLARALRMLARMMVRNYAQAGDHTAIIPVSQTSSTLTVSPNPRPDHDTNNEAA